MESVLPLIHKLQPEGAQKLSADDVYIHYGEVASTRLVECYHFFMGESTLKNVQKELSEGISFLGNHNARSYSMGRTFAGRLERDDEGARAIFGLYMLRDVHPNGEAAPGTDDLHRMIDAGQVFDISGTFHGYKAVCDVCGHDLWAYDEEQGWLCNHIPGSTYKMSASEQKKQKARGVSDGTATWTMEDGHICELSAVYDGAIPHAGFRKSLSMGLGSTLFSFPDGMDRQKPVEGTKKEGLMLSFKLKKNAQKDATALETDQEVVAHVEDEAIILEDPQVAELARQIEAQSARIAELEAATKRSSAEVAVDAAIRAFKVLPAQKDAALKLAQADPKAFELFVSGAGQVLHTEILDGIDGAGARDKIEGKMDADKVHNLTLARIKESGNVLSYKDASLQIMAENPGLADALAEIGG